MTLFSPAPTSLYAVTTLYTASREMDLSSIRKQLEAYDLPLGAKMAKMEAAAEGVRALLETLVSMKEKSDEVPVATRAH